MLKITEKIGRILTDTWQEQIMKGESLTKQIVVYVVVVRYYSLYRYHIVYIINTVIAIYELKRVRRINCKIANGCYLFVKQSKISVHCVWRHTGENMYLQTLVFSLK